MDEIDQIENDWWEKHPMTAPPSAQAQLQLYPMDMAGQPYGLAQTPVQPEPLLARRIVGVPVWGWGLGLGGAALAYYLWQQQQKVTRNPGGGVGSPRGDDDDSGSGGVQTSRTTLGGKIRMCLQKNGVTSKIVDGSGKTIAGSDADKTTIYTDADEAKKKLKQVSPLVTIQCKGVRPPMKELDKLARRDGLSAIEHDSGVVGFYPGGGKKGKEWERYVDALRDEGQTV